MAEVDLVENGIYAIATPDKLHVASQNVLDKYLAKEDTVGIEFKNFQEVLQTFVQNCNLQVDEYMNDFIVEMEWIIEDELKDAADYVTAQFMAYVELIGSRLAWQQCSLKTACAWVDSRDILLTDENWTSANLRIQESTNRFQTLSTLTTIVTSSSVGSTADNENSLISVGQGWSELV